MALTQITLLPMHQTTAILLLMPCVRKEEAAQILLGSIFLDILIMWEIQ